MDSLAKQTTTCDFCKNAISDGGIQADLTEPAPKSAKKPAKKPEKEIYHYCDEECLRQHLNKRAAKSSKAVCHGHSIEVDMHGV